MVSLGQWMMNTPRSRAAETTWFIRGAISATRSVAPLHQCSFHISQITIAVLCGSQVSVFSEMVQSLVLVMLLLLSAVETRDRVWSVSGCAQQTLICNAEKVISNRAGESIERKGVMQRA